MAEKHWTEAPSQTAANGPGYGAGPKYDIEVQLTGGDSNAGTIIDTVVQALKQHFRDTDASRAEARAEIAAFRAEAYSGDYDNLLQTCMRWVEVS